MAGASFLWSYAGITTVQRTSGLCTCHFFNSELCSTNGSFLDFFSRGVFLFLSIFVGFYGLSTFLLPSDALLSNEKIAWCKELKIIQ